MKKSLWFDLIFDVDKVLNFRNIIFGLLKVFLVKTLRNLFDKVFYFCAIVVKDFLQLVHVICIWNVIEKRWLVIAYKY